MPSALPVRLGPGFAWCPALIAAALLVLAPVAVRAAAEQTEIPAPVGFVNDHAGLLSEPDRAKLEAFLDQVKRKTGAEFAVLTVPTTAPLDPAEYKVKVFERWKLGDASERNGLLLLVAVQEHKIWFETGYGLEGTLPDGLQARIILEEMTPRFRAGDYAGGITAGVLRAAARIAREKGVTLEWNGAELRYDRVGSERGMPPVLIGLILVFLLFSFVARIAGGWWGGPGVGRRGGWMGPMM